MAKDCLRVGVIGAGVMGSHHARIYAQLPHVQLVGISDALFARAQDIAAQYGGTPYADFQTLIEEQAPDALSICVPTALHHTVAMYAAQCGVHLLIEKPLALSPIEGTQIVRQAQMAGICLAVGHIERFNPAVLDLKHLIETGAIGNVMQLDARRMGPYPTRIRDVGVVLDLAIHDLDIIQYLCKSDVVQICADVQRPMQREHEDAMTARLQLANGIVCNLSMNWQAPRQVRDLLVRGERATVRVDYLNQCLEFLEPPLPKHNEAWPLPTQPQPARTQSDLLRCELAAFIAAIRGEAPIAVTGEDGLKALTLAQAIIETAPA